MKISVIVVTYRRRDALQHCIASIYRQEAIPYPIELIIVDNGGDAHVAAPGNLDIDVRVFRPATNLGVAGGRNFGIERARGAYLIFLDDDATWHDSHDMAKLVAHLDCGPEYAAVGVRAIDGKTGDVIKLLLPHPDKELLLSVKQPVEAPYFYGCAHILRRSALEFVGCYPERYFYGMEEVDLSLRLINAGYKILYDPEIAIYHPLSPSVKGNRYWKTNALNKSRMAWRLLPHPYTLTTLFVWSAAALWKTKTPKIVLEIWQELLAERDLLTRERRPIRRETVKYLQSVGGRLWY